MHHEGRGTRVSAGEGAASDVAGFSALAREPGGCHVLRFSTSGPRPNLPRGPSPNALRFSVIDFDTNLFKKPCSTFLVNLILNLVLFERMCTLSNNARRICRICLVFSLYNVPATEASFFFAEALQTQR